MGRIYSYTEIQNRAVPLGIDNFDIAKAEIFSELAIGLRDGKVYGAKLFGSVAMGTPNLRSDLDLMIVLQNEDLDFARRLGIVFGAIKNSLGVSVEPIMTTKYLAERGMSTVDPYLLEHLRVVPTDLNTIGEDPSNIIIASSENMSESYKIYMARKIRRLRQGLTTIDEAERLHVLQRSLEAPASVGRKTLQAVAKLGLGSFLPASDGKRDVVRRFSDIFEDVSLYGNYRSLLENDVRYSALLREAVSGGISQRDYDSSVNDLFEQCVPSAVELTSDLAHLYNKLEGATFYQEGQVGRRIERV